METIGSLSRILITRPQPGASETAIRVKALGMIPVVAPVLSIVTKETRAPDAVAAILVTSRNAIEACLPSFRSRPLFAVGTATANQAIQAGFTRVFNADGDASGLVDLVVRTLSPADGTLFLPTAQGQGTELAASLRLRGFRVIRRIAYKAAGVPVLPEAAVSALLQRQVAAAMFFSGETSRHFVHLVLAAKLADTFADVEAVSISEHAGMPLKSLPWRRIVVASEPNQNAMLALLK